MKLVINGNQVEVSENLSQLLLWVLRDELGLIGTKFGCGAGICGACTVHVNSTAVRSCITPLASLNEGDVIRTAEGLAQPDAAGAMQLHPIQIAFLDKQVPQCSWCMSGQMMTAVAFLEQNPAPTDEEIVNAMGNNYCRCGCYVRIKSAVRQAATLMAAEGATPWTI
jgi:isoquinoline 1-oxidoreductase alpha subunit